MNFDRLKLLNRKSINNILKGSFNYRLIYVSASGGYGKTTALKNFLNTCGNLNILWFTLSEWNFNSDLILTDFYKELETFFKMKISGNILNIIDKIKCILNIQTIFVIDDFYLNKSEEFKRFLSELCKNDISNLSVFILNRYAPDIDIQLNQDCLILNQNIFEFSKNEINELFLINNKKLTDTQIEDIYLYSEGWSAAVYIMLEQYIRNNNLNYSLSLSSFCNGLVYEQVKSEKYMEFLMMLSYIDLFTIEQAEFITKDNCIGQVIRNLCSNQCFINYNEQNKHYRIHNILKENMQENAKIKCIDGNKILSLNGDWYYSLNDYTSALKNYYKSGNYEKIYITNQNDFSIDILYKFTNVVIDIFNRINEEMKIKYPIAYLTYIYYYVFNINSYQGYKFLNDAKEFFLKSCPERNDILAEIYLIESFNYIKNTEKFSDTILKAREFFNGKKSKIINEKIEFNFGVPCILYLYHKNKGCMKKLVNKLKEIFKIFYQISNNCGIGLEQILQGEYYIETGSYALALKEADKAIYKANYYKQKNIIVESTALKVRLSLLDGNYKNAQSLLQDLENIKQNCTNRNLKRQVDMCLGYGWAIIGNLNKIPKWIRDYRIEDAENKFESSQACFIMYGLAMILNKDFDILEAHSEIMENAFYDNSNIYRLIYSLIFNVIANYNYSNMEIAETILKKTLDFAQYDNIRLPFIELSPHYINVLKNVYKKDNCDKLLLDECLKYTNYYNRHNHIINCGKFELSIRETEIMNMIIDGKKQKEIAETLFIAVPTVKTHVKNIYNKLGVSNKNEATKKWLQ